MNTNGNAVNLGIDSIKLRRIQSILRLAQVRAGSTAAHGKIHDFSVAACALRDAFGLTDDDLAWLSRHELVEIKHAGGGGRGKRRLTGAPAAKSAVTLSDAGLSWARRLCAISPSKGGHHRASANDRQSDIGGPIPLWDPDYGEWSVEGKLVKRLAEHATAQRLVLDAAQAANWVNPIASPWAALPPRARSARLRRVIAQLNGHQREARIHISATGKAIHFVWWHG